MYMCVCAYMCLQVPTEARGIALLELELQGLVGHLMWVLGIQPLVSVRAMRSRKR